MTGDVVPVYMWYQFHEYILLVVPGMPGVYYLLLLLLLYAYLAYEQILRSSAGLVLNTTAANATITIIVNYHDCV